MSKNLSYFMRETAENIFVPAPEGFVDENNERIQMEIRPLPQARIEKLRGMYRTREVARDKRGNPLVMNGEVVWKVESDNNAYTNRLLAESLVYPDLTSKELMDFYKCPSVDEMAPLVFSRVDEYAYVVNEVLKAIGLRESDTKTELDDAKN